MAGVLVVEDERDLLELLRFNLKQAGYQTAVATTGGEALSLIAREVPDLVLLDIMLPDVSGTEICRRIKSEPRTQHLPVIMVTARGKELDRLVGLELGADDYITKPFNIREVLLRVRAVLRRGVPHEAGRAREQVGPVRIDLEDRRAYLNGQALDLTALEFRLLATFLARAGRLQTRETLLRDVWDLQGGIRSRTVDTHVKRLREKLGPASGLIETVRGAGYRMRDPDG